jgi:hypothetical protein
LLNNHDNRARDKDGAVRAFGPEARGFFSGLSPGERDVPPAPSSGRIGRPLAAVHEGLTGQEAPAELDPGTFDAHRRHKLAVQKHNFRDVAQLG